MVGVSSQRSLILCLDTKGNLEIIWLTFLNNLDWVQKVKHTWKVTHTIL